MNDKEKLKKACELLRIAIDRQAQPSVDVNKKWVQMSLTSTQKRSRPKL
jgi:hypothetical protein